MQSISAQRHRINRVINFVRSHSADALDLNALADVACLSKFHFSRTFDACLNETPIEHLWRVRTENAARSLAFARDKSITDIAMDCGFSSSQTFSRGFRQRFGMSPKTFKETNKWLDTSWNRCSDQYPIHEPYSPITIENRPAYRVAYIRHIGPYCDVNGSMTTVFKMLIQWAKTMGIWASSDGIIGVCPDNKDLTPIHRCVYDVSIPVPDGIVEDDVVSIQTVPAGTYAVMDFQGNTLDVYAAWEWLITAGLAKTGTYYGLLSSYEYYPKSSEQLVGPASGLKLCQRIETL